MIKTLFHLIIFIHLNSFAQDSDQLLGKWMSIDNSVKVEVYKVSNDFRAKVLWFNYKLGKTKTPMHLCFDNLNPNPLLRNRKILGMDILFGLTFNSITKQWENGKIYDASSGRYWSSYAKLSDNGILKVRGFWKFEWIGRTINFRKTKQ